MSSLVEHNKAKVREGTGERGEEYAVDESLPTFIFLKTIVQDKKGRAESFFFFVPGLRSMHERAEESEISEDGVSDNFVSAFLFNLLQITSFL